MEDRDIVQALTDLCVIVADIRDSANDFFYDHKRNYCCNDYFHCVYKNNCEYSNRCKLDSLIYESESK